MHKLEAEAGTLEQNGWTGTDAQEVEPTQRVSVTKRVRVKRTVWTGSDDAYEILGVRRGATAHELRAAYLRLVKEHHPDRCPPVAEGREGDAGERLKAINEAYRQLKAAAGGRDAARGKAIRFAFGALTSALPMLAIVGAYLAGWIGPRTPGPEVAVVAAGPRQGPGQRSGDSQSGTGTTSLEKDSAVGRQTAFADAKRQATKAAWARFIADYPGGEPEAYTRQAIATIERAEVADARRREARLAWTAVEKGTKADIQQFIARHSDGEFIGKAKLALAAIARAEEAAWAAAERDGTKEALQRFLNKHPDGDLVGKAKVALGAIARAEQAAWVAAERAGSKETLLRFLNEHADAPQAPLAGKALAAFIDAESKAQVELESWARAKNDGSKAALSKYLSEHPLGRHVQEARTRVARLEAGEWDEAAWHVALQADNKTAYLAYLAAHPGGRHATAARVRLAELETTEMQAKEAVKEARVDTAKMPPPAKRPSALAEEMPFIGADGRIRR
jgi:curved DNA-binding protein CbpA